MHTSVFCSCDSFSLMICKFNLMIFCLINIIRSVSFIRWSILLRRRFRSCFTICFCYKIIQFFDNNFIIFCSFIRSRLNIFQISINCIQTFKKQINHRTVYCDLIATYFLKHIFHIMGKMLHTLKSHGSSHSF